VVSTVARRVRRIACSMLGAWRSADGTERFRLEVVAPGDQGSLVLVAYYGDRVLLRHSL